MAATVQLPCPLDLFQNMNAHQRLEAITDLSHLSPASDDLIVSCLRERFMTDNIYTSIGTLGLVALNPHKYVASNSDSVLHKYAAEYRDTSERKQPLPPHIFQLTNSAYYHMRRTTQYQTIIFRYVVVLSFTSLQQSQYFQRRNRQRKVREPPSGNQSVIGTERQ